jgi:hypothetical protein
MLQAFAVRGWLDAPRRYAGQSSISRDGSARSLERYVAARQQSGDSYVELHVARPDGDLPGFRSWVAGNLIRAATRSANRPRTRSPQDDLTAAELERAVQAGQAEWRGASMRVDEASVDFEYLPIGESTWIAIAGMPDAYLGVGARGVLFDDLALVRVEPASADEG